MNRRVQEKLERGTLLLDGATGTFAKTLPGWPDGPVELACVTAPDAVLGLHRAYLNAGSAAIKTNTFAAHVGLACEDAARQRRVIAAAAELAMHAAEPFDALVFGDIGPAPADCDAQAAYMAMADVMLAAGLECFLFETMGSDEGIAQTAQYIRNHRPDAFIAVSFAADPDGFTRAGEVVDSLIERMEDCADIDAVGLNCICGAYHMMKRLGELPAPKKIRMAMPNAGYPHVIDGRMYYDSDPVYYAQQAAACAAQGATILGGCCGTTPEHIRQTARMLDTGRIAPRIVSEKKMDGHAECTSGLYRKLMVGKRVVLVELDPPKDAGIASFIDGAKRLVRAGADAITVADCPIGRARMDSSLLSCKLTREYGIEAVPHMTCRDRNVNATKALLLGLSMEGVHNVLAVTGDPVPTSDRGSVKSVFQFNSRVLARFVSNLARSGETEPFLLCGALNVNAANFDAELERAMDKERCGMTAFLTQPVLSERAAENMEKAKKALTGWLIGGIFPVVSEKNARFLQSEVAGIDMDEAVAAAYAGLDRAAGEDMAVRLCADAARRIAPFVDGYYIMTPFQRVGLVERVIGEIEKIDVQR